MHVVKCRGFLLVPTPQQRFVQPRYTNLCSQHLVHHSVAEGQPESAGAALVAKSLTHWSMLRVAVTYDTAQAAVGTFVAANRAFWFGLSPSNNPPWQVAPFCRDYQPPQRGVSNCTQSEVVVSYDISS